LAKPGAGGSASNGGGAECSANGGGGGGGGGSGGGGARALALQEEQVNRLGELLMETLEETATMIEKKQARTYDEIERDLALAAEEEAMQVDEDEDEEEEEKPIYNPLNLPLGFDGKPIPYWLYKLHGLNLEFKCEICGNYSYWGPRPFERHFQEWRHSYGMKCLGIPNTKPFQGITLIEDAYTLHAKLRAEDGSTTFNPEMDEEFEDRTGNVMNRKVYTDLARQGLLDAA
jgi:splicing factor 3A subunit 3